ncbi:helix-hairpin-helix domain-containing protein [Prevotella sp.]
MGYDHYAYYAVIRKLGRLKTLALGQYKLRFGMGLAMNTGFTLGKTTAATMSVPNNSITPNSSRSDAYYLQGAATSIEVSRNMDITAFASYRKIDATLNKDGTIKTLLKTGYHRTESEMQRKHNASQTTTGGNIRWHSGGWHVGLTGVYTAYSDSLKPDKRQAYRKYNPTGIHFYNTSIDYGYINHRVNINGETAINDKGAVATINAIALKASQSLTLTAIQRFYSYRYYSMFSAAFSDGGKVQNESGIYLGAAWNPSSRLSVLAYSDYAYFPWARYLVSEKSHSWDNLIQASYRLSPLLTLNSRYRLRMREEDYNDKELKSKYLIDKTEHRARLSLIYANTHWSAKTQGDASYVVYPDGLSAKPSSFGWMVSQNMAYTNSRISATANVGYFHTHDYNSRIYTYENGTLYTFSFPMFYGEGMRGAMLLRGNIGSHLIILYKVGATKYFDRDKISSSYQQINSSWQADIDLQIRWKF